MELFEPSRRVTKVTSLPGTHAPLAERMRPVTLEDFLGQEHLIGTGKPLRQEILADQLGSMILWGPPGCGKTTLVRIMARHTKKNFVPFSAVLGGVKEVREIVDEAKILHQRSGRQTILFVDEIHRFNKAQQDAFLPHVENGTIILIGATTENPSFEIIAPLLSRCRVLTLQPLADADLLHLARRTWQTQQKDPPADSILLALVRRCFGDARRLMNLLEALSHVLNGAPHTPLTVENLAEILSSPSMPYDRKGEEHYNVISAFIKSMRGSDPDATLHYLARMLEAGEDPAFVARRMIIFASEDIGNADPRALPLAVATAESFDRIGMPEGFIPLAHCATYLACAPKSNATYTAYLAARRDIQDGQVPPVPLHLRNAPTKLMANLGYGEGYRYPHHDTGNINEQRYLPESLADRIYYQPTENGLESQIKGHLQRLRRLRKGTKP